MSNRFPLSLKQLRAFLRSPWALLFALTLGIILGIQSPEVDAVLKPVGQLYLSLLKMCVLPILISGIILNIASLVAQPHFSNYLLRFCQVFLATMFLVSTSGFLITSALGPGRFLDPTTLSNLGILILDESGLDLEIPLELAIASIPEPDPLGTFLLDIVPENIFNALSNGNVLQVLFAAILFGLSLGTSYRQQKVSDPVFEVFDNIYQSFSKLIDWLILFLPLGLLSLIASQVAITGLDAIRIMGKFVLCSVVMFTLFYVSSLFVIAQTTQLSFSKTFK
ncbi:MAG: dicarboxylate/amino acid:cation symporter, partial [Prochlorothrix sp.]